jgi:hypothetical protein
MGILRLSYPPLVHQLIGLLSNPIGPMPLFALILWTTLPSCHSLHMPSRVNRKISCGHALYAAFCPVYLTAISRPLPLGGDNHCLVWNRGAGKYLRSDRLDGVPLRMATTMAFHHATLLFLLADARSGIEFCPESRSMENLTIRLCVFGVLSTLFILLVIWPSGTRHTQTIQTPIDHPHAIIFKDPSLLSFFPPMHGPSMVLILYF